MKSVTEVRSSTISELCSWYLCTPPDLVLCVSICTVTKGFNYIIIYKPAIWHMASCQVSQCQGIHIYMHSLSHSLFKLVLSSSGVVWTQPAASTAGDSRPVWLLFCCTWHLLSFAMSFSVLCVSSHHMQQKTLFLLVCCVPFLPHVLHISWTAESTHGTMVSSVSWYPVLHC